tara:strand:+ start:4540 stop:4767 length:228 start_codon:yes stop_codon:yes gene_type:complete
MSSQQYKSDAMDLLVKLQHENSVLVNQIASLDKWVKMVCEKLGCELKDLPATLEALNIGKENAQTTSSKKNTKAG